MICRKIIFALFISIVFLVSSIGTSGTYSSPLKSTSIPMNDFHWGFILNSSFSLDYIEYSFGDKYSGCVGPTIFVFGIGRHNVSWELTADAYSHNGTQHHNDYRSNYEHIYLFKLKKIPHVKLRVNLSYHAFAYPWFSNGTFSLKVWIDGEQVYEEEVEYEHIWRDIWIAGEVNYPPLK